MKKIFLFSLLSLLLNLDCFGNSFDEFNFSAPAPMGVDSHFNVIVGLASGSTYTVSYNRTLMKSEWQAYIGASAPDFDSSSFAIIQIGGLYYLTGSAAGGFVKSSILLELDNGCFYVTPKGTCTCTSSCCQLGCSPTWSETLAAWYCTNCSIPPSHECTSCGKTETSGSSSNSIFKN